MADLTANERQSDSPLVQRIWHSRSEHSSAFISMAEPHWEMVITKLHGTTTLTVRGPETKPTPAYTPAGGEFLGIQFRLGTLMPPFPPEKLMDRRDVNLPQAGDGSFWLHGAAWQFPTFENADTFVERLVRDGLLLHDPVVGAVLQGQQPSDVSLRTVQRRFLRATGLTQGATMQIERARYATTLLKQGVSILDVVDRAGYADQPHLTRSLKHYVGQTPAQLSSESRDKPLSFLFALSPY